jgi:polyphenol oxidase
MRKDGFILRESCGIVFYSCTALETIPDICHGFSTRKGGAGGTIHSLNLNYTTWDSKERVDDNRRQFLSALHLKGMPLATLHQVHSSRVYIIKDEASEWNQPQGDALATASKNVALAVKTADCLPVLLADPVTHAIGAVHSGWRGTLAGILPQTVSAMQQAFGCSPSDLLVAVGPGIRSCCFEVEIDVAGAFLEKYGRDDLVKPRQNLLGKYLLDLCGILDIQMEAAGIPAANRFDACACTVCNPELFFSHRAQGAASGRMMAVIGRKDGSLLNNQSAESGETH